MTCDCHRIERLRVQPGDIVIVRFPELGPGTDYQEEMQSIRDALNTAGHFKVPGIALIGDVQLDAIPREALDAVLAGGTGE